MTALSMTAEEREAFLADVHVGVLAVERPGGPPSVTPVWYRYVDGVVEIVTSGGTRKVELLCAAGHASLCAQVEAPTPAYVTVEGPVSVTSPVPDGVVASIAARYLGGEEAGAAYAEGPGSHDDTLISLRVQRWRTADFAKIGF